MTKTFAEHCLTIDINNLIKRFRLTRSTSLSIHWNSGSEFESYPSSINVIKDMEDPDGTIYRLRLKYTQDSEEGREEIDTPIRLIRHPCNLGGERYLFECPRCYNSVYKLSKSPIENIFLCRKCNDLTYFSKNSIYNHYRHTKKIEKIDEQLKERHWAKTRNKLMLEKERLSKL